MAGKFPPWLRRPWASGETFGLTKGIVDDLKLHTVCQSAHCPNIGECWANGTATVMVLGNTCTRNCTFCSVPSGKPVFDDPSEPKNVAQAVKRMGLNHAVVTTVVRDDLPDGGAKHIAETIRHIHAVNPRTTVEILVSDFHGDKDAIQTVLDAKPEVFCHNIETVERLYPKIRDRRFTYRAALDVLRIARNTNKHTIVKSALMVGNGETPDEVRATLQDLKDAGCEAVCIGQYLQPTKQQADVEEFVHPDQFAEYETWAYDMGFPFAVSAPFVRSSYKSELVLETDYAKQKLGLKEASTATS
ncbi:MAG: lipoyl synthase [Candidatus Hydrogenedentota bacterium]|nr:MAG: lipoyl synthase [Candidatus Hydrogenedentota bacterium]